MVNYRRQLVGRGDQPVWFAPRLSVVLPSGSTRKRTGLGGPGLQFSLPLSTLLQRNVVTHWNLGATVTRANADGRRTTLRSLTAAASAIWLLAPNLDLMLESAWDRTEALDDVDARGTANHFVLLPGVRGAINFSSGMQIVPGFGVPIGIGPGRGERDLLFYLSVEHPFLRVPHP